MDPVDKIVADFKERSSWIYKEPYRLQFSEVRKVAKVHRYWTI